MQLVFNLVYFDGTNFPRNWTRPMNYIFPIFHQCTCKVPKAHQELQAPAERQGHQAPAVVEDVLVNLEKTVLPVRKVLEESRGKVSA